MQPNISAAQSCPGPDADASGLDALNHVSAVCAEHEAEALRQNHALVSLLKQILKPNAQHLAPAELRALVQRRRQDQATWELPEHLSVCPLCLDLFTAFESEARLPSNPDLKRYRRLFRPPRPAIQRARILVSWRYPVPAIAASLLIMAAAIYLLVSGIGRTSGKILAGSGNLAAGSAVALAAGSDLPYKQDIMTATGVQLSLADGSLVNVAAQSQFRLITSWAGSATLYLNHGEVNLVVTKQTLGRTLSVRTALGEVIVMGTQFQVKTIDNLAMVYQQTAGNNIINAYREQIQAVVVSVTEGVVKVRNARDEVLVPAGYSATIHSDQPVIDRHRTINESAP